jgi:hypothetical protein
MSDHASMFSVSQEQFLGSMFASLSFLVRWICSEDIKEKLRK